MSFFGKFKPGSVSQPTLLSELLPSESDWVK